MEVVFLYLKKDSNSELSDDIELHSNKDSLPTTTPIMEKLERETEADELLQALARVVHER